MTSLISGKGKGRVFQKMVTMSNQALKIILGKFMELNRAGPKASSYCISPAKLILAGEDPYYICSDAVSFLPLRDTPPA